MNLPFRKTLNKMEWQSVSIEHSLRLLDRCSLNLVYHNHFWAEAVSTATYLRNRSPTKAVARMTPYEAWTGLKPQVGGLRVFGCQAFVHVLKDERKKLDSKSKKCIFLGYGANTKGYRLYDPVKRKICHSRDVIFNENKYGHDELPESEQCSEKHVYLEFTDEPTEQELPPRRSTRERRPPDYYGQHSLSTIEEPKSTEEALKDKKWCEAMKAEIDSLNQHDVWDLVELPENQKPVGSKWVLKIYLPVSEKECWILPLLSDYSKHLYFLVLYRCV